MQHAPETSSAELAPDILQDAIRVSRDRALEHAGKQELAVKDVQNVQRDELKALLYGGAKGTDGESAQGPMELPPEAEAAVTEDHEERMSSLGDAKDAYVLDRTDATVGVQHDDDRSIGIAGEVLADAEMAERVARHEAEHREQEVGNAVAAIPETGDAILDAEGGVLERLTFRENGAVEAEGGLKDHTPEYHRYVEVSQATAEYLNGAGMNGDELVRAAGKTNEGFSRMQDAVIMASVRHRLDQAGALSLSA